MNSTFPSTILDKSSLSYARMFKRSLWLGNYRMWITKLEYGSLFPLLKFVTISYLLWMPDLIIPQQKLSKGLRRTKFSWVDLSFKFMFLCAISIPTLSMSWLGALAQHWGEELLFSGCGEKSIESETRFWNIVLADLLLSSFPSLFFFMLAWESQDFTLLSGKSMDHQRCRHQTWALR